MDVEESIVQTAEEIEKQAGENRNRQMILNMMIVMSSILVCLLLLIFLVWFGLSRNSLKSNSDALKDSTQDRVLLTVQDYVRFPEVHIHTPVLREISVNLTSLYSLSLSLSLHTSSKAHIKKAHQKTHIKKHTSKTHIKKHTSKKHTSKTHIKNTHQKTHIKKHIKNTSKHIKNTSKTHQNTSKHT